VHKPLHRHRRVHKARRYPRINGEFQELADKNEYNDSVVLSKKNSRHCAQNKIDRLIEENRILTMKLERSDANPGKSFRIDTFIITLKIFY
jgi:hypothetical protein